MDASSIIFYIIAVFTLGTALLAVTTRKIFRSAIWLLFSLVGIAGMYFWMQVEFIAAVQIIVYVGGIVVLIIFSIFLTQNSGKEMPKTNWKRIVFSALAALSGLGFSFNLINEYGFTPTVQSFSVKRNRQADVKPDAIWLCVTIRSGEYVAFGSNDRLYCHCHETTGTNRYY
jgi:NADH:ubiquinone oxidoreductase subunit 6 (subunit J)